MSVDSVSIMIYMAQRKKRHADRLPQQILREIVAIRNTQRRIRAHCETMKALTEQANAYVGLVGGQNGIRE